MNYKEKMRKAIECPQFGNTNYGDWGALTLEQRTLIKRLLDEMDSADNYIKKLYFENKNLEEALDKIKNICDGVPSFWGIVGTNVIHDIEEIIYKVKGE